MSQRHAAVAAASLAEAKESNSTDTVPVATPHGSFGIVRLIALISVVLCVLFSAFVLSPIDTKVSAMTVCIHHSRDEIPAYHVAKLIEQVRSLSPYSTIFFIDSSASGMPLADLGHPAAQIRLSEELTHFGRRQPTLTHRSGSSKKHRRSGHAHLSEEIAVDASSSSSASSMPMFSHATVFVLRDDRGDQGLGPTTLEEVVRRRLVGTDFLLHLDSDHQLLPHTNLAGMERYLLLHPNVAIVAGNVVGNRLDDDPSWREALIGGDRPDDSVAADSGTGAGSGKAPGRGGAVGRKRSATGKPPLAAAAAAADQSTSPGTTTVAFGVNIHDNGQRLEAVEVEEWRSILQPTGAARTNGSVASAKSHPSKDHRHVEDRLRQTLGLSVDQAWDDGCHPVAIASGFWLARTRSLQTLPVPQTAVWEAHEPALWLGLFTRFQRQPAVRPDPAAPADGIQKKRSGRHQRSTSSSPPPTASWAIRPATARFCSGHAVQRIPFAAPQSPSNFSAAALCTVVPESIETLRLPYWSVDCKMATVCVHGRLRNPSWCLKQKSGPSRPALVSCPVTERIGSQAPPPFARGAHKSVTLAQYRGVPMVLKRTPTETKAANVSKFTHEVDEEWFFLSRLSANPFRASPFLMTFYGGCLGESEYGERQAVLADGPFAMMR